MVGEYSSKPGFWLGAGLRAPHVPCPPALPEMANPNADGCSWPPASCFGMQRKWVSPQTLRSLVPSQWCSARAGAAQSCGDGTFWFSCRTNERACPRLLFFFLFGDCKSSQLQQNARGSVFISSSFWPACLLGRISAKRCHVGARCSSPVLSSHSAQAGGKQFGWETSRENPSRWWLRRGRMGRWHFSYQIISHIGHGLLLCCLLVHETLRPLPSPNPPPDSLSRTQWILSCAVPEAACSSVEMVASESCQELPFYEVSVIPWDRWELVALHPSDFYPFITSRERERKLLFSRAPEPWQNHACKGCCSLFCLN